MVGDFIVGGPLLTQQGADSRVWQEARALALPPAVVASSLAARPYDLRHSALST